MDNISSGASSKTKSYHKAHLLEELVEVKKQIVHKDEKISQLAQRLQRLEQAHARKNQQDEDKWSLIILPKGTINTNHNNNILLIL